MGIANVAFRVDAGTAIGHGHVARCLTLADVLAARGVRCRFVCREHEGHALDRIRDRGHETTGLPVDGRLPVADENPSPPHAAWLGAPWSIDARETVAALRAARVDSLVDWLVVDHYGIDARWERSLRAETRRIMVLDDLTDRPHDCDLLLDQTLGVSVTERAAMVSSGCRLLTGPMYALLRPAFARARPGSLARRATGTAGAPRQLLVTMGGVDRDDATGATLDALGRIEAASSFRVTVVIGAGAPRIERLKDRIRCAGTAIDLRIDEPDMAGVMAASDLCIGAAGGTAWERCCVGLPSVIVTLADNQRAVATALSGAGAVISAALPTLETDLAIALSRSDLSAWLEHAGACAARVTDGLGGGRVADALYELAAESAPGRFTVSSPASTLPSPSP